jgi:hypothetical protein
MAVISVVNTRLQTNTISRVWTPMLNGDTGQPVEVGDFADYSIQFGGTFGAGGTVVMEGSNDGSTYFTLTDAQAVTISKTSAALEQIAEVVRYIRPSVTAGDGTTSITVSMYGRRGR